MPIPSIIDRYNEAEQLKNSSKPEEAEKILLEILQSEPTHVLSHLTLARIYTGLDRHDEAVTHAERACELEPTESFNFTLLSVTYQRAYAGTGDHRFIRMAEDAMARSRML
jgi:predicted Zn-dependent protease